MARDPDPPKNRSEKAPDRYWNATHSFRNLRLSNCIEIVLTVALLIVAGTQALIYSRQAQIMETQTDIAGKQWDALRDQLAEMRSGAAQTERAIAATNRLADEALRSADAALQSSEQTRRLADEAKRSADAFTQVASEAAKSSSATGKLANLGQEANAISQRSLIGIQRAFVSVTGVKLEPFVAREFKKQEFNAWRLHVGWENSGNTPTRDLTIKLNCFIGALVKDPYISHSSAEPIWKVSTESINIMLGPRQRIDAGSCEFASIVALVAQTWKLNFSLYATGTASYRDIFNEKNIHVTEYCLYVTYITVSGTIEHPDISALTGMCATHNCVEDECRKK